MNQFPSPDVVGARLKLSRKRARLTQHAAQSHETAMRLSETSPLLMAAELLKWVDRLDRDEVSEGQFARFCAVDRLASRVIAGSCRSMARLVKDLVVHFAAPTPGKEAAK